MKQVCLVRGAIAVVDVSPPVCGPRDVLVRTAASLISTGTELAVTNGGGGGLIGRAASSPNLVRKVRTKVGEVGVRRTMELVRARASLFVPLGYSASGEVVEVGRHVRHVKVGDHVACAGAGYANHAEINAVPHSLVARMPPGLDFPRAAFTTVGAIAIHGVRRAAPTLGDQVVVVGLGLVGQIAAQLLRLSGCRVLGIDIRRDRIDLARTMGLEEGVDPGDCDPRAAVTAWTRGIGADAVLVCASGRDASLLDQSLDLCRRKGRLVLIGDVPIQMSREKLFRREIDFLISCSYGPGRYDSRYEREGQDYPLPYVRWTEGRNLAEVLRLLGNGHLRVMELVGSRRPVTDAARAYEDLRGRPDRPVAALIDYPRAAPTEVPLVVDLPRVSRRSSSDRDRVVLGVIGAGVFFRSVHLSNLRRHGGFDLKRVVTRAGANAAQLAVRERVPIAGTDPRSVIDDPDIQAVLIATRHDLHARLAIDAVRAGKHVLVEKPLGLTTGECRAVMDAAASSGVLVAVGFNRRFAPLAEAARQTMARVREPHTILYRINAGPLPPDHWLLDPVEGGGRLIGEGVHFFDFVRWLTGEDPLQVTAAALDRGGAAGTDLDNVAVNVAFRDGSLATVLYTSHGHPGLPKERVEIFGGNQVLVIDDFARLERHGGPNRRDQRRWHADKGHAALLANFHQAVTGRAPLGVTAADGYWATWCAEQAQASIAGGTLTQGRDDG